MKTKALIYFSIFFIGAHAYGQWENISIQVPYSFTSVSFIEENVGFIAGGKEVYKTYDGGISWELSFRGDTFASIEEVLVVNDSLILAVGQDYNNGQSLIFRSKDSGQSWKMVDNNFFSRLRSLYFINDIGFAVGTHKTILHTLDKGLTWQKMNSPFTTNPLLESVFFSTTSNGYVVGGIPGSSNYARTLDGGLNWEEITINTTSYLQSVFFIDSLHGYIVGWNGEILVTDDAGESWTHQTSVNMGGNLEILFTNDSTGYIVGGLSQIASIQKTTDRGLNWFEIGPDLPNAFVAVDFPSENVGYVVGQAGVIVKTTNGGISAVQSGKEDLQLMVYPNPSNNSINIESPKLISMIQLFDGSGTKIYYSKVNANSHHLNLAHLSPGNYYIMIHAGDNSGIRKIVKIQ